MKYSKTTTTTTAAAEGCRSSLSLTSPPPVVAMIQSPCAACKTLRRRCAEKCVLAPYFPPAEPLKFAIAHRVFGASNIIKLLQELEECEREDAVNSMVYEANARLRDPIYGCAGAICNLQKQINELQAELAKAQAEILNIQCQNANLLDQICTQNHVEEHHDFTLPYDDENPTMFLDEGALGVSWEPLNWT